MTYCFICYLETLQDLSLNLCSLGRNIRGVTAKQMGKTVPIFDLSFYENYFPHKHRSTFVQRLVPFLHTPDDSNSFFFFRERKAVSSRYEYAAFCGEHRCGITITNICVALQHVLRLATSIR